VCVCVFVCDHVAWMLVYERVGVVCVYTGMHRITTFPSTTDRIYDDGPIRLKYYYIILL